MAFENAVKALIGTPVRVTGGAAAKHFPKGIVGRLQLQTVEVLGEDINVYQVFNEAQDLPNVDQPGVRFLAVNIDVMNQNTKLYPEIVLYNPFEGEDTIVKKFA